MKSMSIVDQGSSTFAGVCRCSSGVRRASRPWIHICAGEKVVMQEMTPTQAGSAVAARADSRIPARSVSTGSPTISTGMSEAASSVSAMVRDCAATWSSVSGPYRPWLPVRNQISRVSKGLCMGPRLCVVWRPGSALAVDVLVAVVEGVDQALLDGQRLPELSGDVHGARDLLDHHGGLHRGAGVLADGERAVVLHQHGRAAMALQRL